MLLANSYFLQNGEYILADLVNIDTQQFKLKRFYLASTNIQDFVNIEVAKGDLTKVLEQPDLLALSVSEATRVFGHTDIIGKTLTHQRGLYTVGAVFDDMPENTHFGFDVLTYLPKLQRGPFDSHVYLKLHKGTDIKALAQEMTADLHRRSPNRKLQKFDLIALKDVHFNSNGEFEMKQGGSYLALQVSIGLAAMLVLIASVNFINFNITGAARRAKEIGVRKTLGATKVQLVSQFLLESLLIVILAGTIAMQLVELSLPAFNQLMDRQLTLEYQSPFMLLVMLAIVAVGLLSGLYPALFMSSFSAKRVLSGDLNRGSIAIWLRKFTLCAQCTVSISLLIAAFTLYTQMSLIQELEIGYAKQDRLVVKGLPSELLYQKDGSALLDELNLIEGVEKVTLSDTNYASSMMMTLSFTWPNGEKLTGMQPNIVTGFNAVETLGLTLLAGRDFSPKFSGDWYEEDNQGNRTAGLLVSKRMAELAGYSNLDDVLGLTLTIPRRNLSVKIVGVVEDIRLGSVTKPILPSSFILGFIRNAQANIVLKVNTANKQALVSQVQSILIEQISRSDVSINWIEDDVLAAHKNESLTLTMVSLFSPLAIILTCLGTFGLASFTTLRRQKEVAVRKVLGASRLSIVNVLAHGVHVDSIYQCRFGFPCYLLIS